MSRRLKRRAYFAWRDCVRRCTDPRDPRYSQYGARGIKVCKRWLVYENFLADMGQPEEGYTLDRIDVNKDYSKKNCRWAPAEVQANNKQNTVWLEAFGRRQALREWSRELGIHPVTLYHRIAKLGWSHEKALSKVPEKGRENRVKP